MQRGKEQELRRSLREIREAIDAYKRAADEGAIEKPADKTGYPPTLAVLVEGASDKRRPERQAHLFPAPRPAPIPMSGEPVGPAQLCEPAPTRRRRATTCSTSIRTATRPG